jgi:HTH-type transcriptional regulator / antitoxin HigA
VQKVSEKLTASEFASACNRFAELAKPLIEIRTKRDWSIALDVIDALMADGRDRLDAPRQALIGMLADAVDRYEDRDAEMAAFAHRAHEGPADLALLRVLMDQHGLGVADLPEIGSKSMVSRVLSGERDLSKRHIARLAERFGIDPGLFF